MTNGKKFVNKVLGSKLARHAEVVVFSRASDGQHLPTVNEIEPSLMRFLPKWTVRVSIFLKLTARNVKEPPADAEEEHRRVLFICSGRVELRSTVRKVVIFHSIEQRETNIYLLVVSEHFPTMHTSNVPLDDLDVGDFSSFRNAPVLLESLRNPYWFEPAFEQLERFVR